MQQISVQCTNCGAFTRRSLYHEEDFQSFMLLERLRTSNLPATDQETSRIRHTILPTVSDDISSINSKIASLLDIIRSMEAERESLTNVQKKYSNLISLHRTLPSEVLSKIFLYTNIDTCNPYMLHASDSNAINAFGSMWLLSHVCQQWRNIVLSLRSFWSTSYLRFPQAAQCEGAVQRLEAVRQRSRQGLLDISLVSCHFYKPRSDPSILKRILDIVLAESYRLRVLHLSDDDGTLNMLYPQLHNRLPHLQSLSLNCDQIEPKEQSVFKVCPSLTNLSLGGSRPVVEFPWDQIVELDLSGIDLDGNLNEFRACMRSIGLCTSLESLSTSYWYWEDHEAESPYPTTTCSIVRKLDAMSVRLIDALTLPCLQWAFLHLEPLPEPSANYNNAMYSFKQLLIRSNCLSDLTSISLDGIPLAALQGHTLRSILSRTHNLTFLDLDVNFDDATYARDHDRS